MFRYAVLILVVVEDGLVPEGRQYINLITSLNPYCSGRWYRTKKSLRTKLRKLMVLILIVVEDGLVPIEFCIQWIKVQVLILIVVEDGLVRWYPKFFIRKEWGLNPYCSGRWSRTYLLI